jgi:hypothetical protein
MELELRKEQTATGIIHLKRVKLTNSRREQKTFITVMKSDQSNNRRQGRERYLYNRYYYKIVMIILLPYYLLLYFLYIFCLCFENAIIVLI